MNSKKFVVVTDSLKQPVISTERAAPPVEVKIRCIQEDRKMSDRERRGGEREEHDHYQSPSPKRSSITASHRTERSNKEYDDSSSKRSMRSQSERRKKRSDGSCRPVL